MKLFSADMSRIERWLWYIFLFTIPWQTRLILYSPDAVFSEWRAVAFWLTDGLMLALFVVAWWRGWKVSRHDRIDWLLVPVLAAGAISLIGATAPDIGLYQLARLAQFALFFLYLRHWAFARVDADASVLAFVLGAIVQAGIALGQSAVQHDLGLRLLGETLLNPFMHGVAVFYDSPLHKVMRAYGTLPHPNVTALVFGLASWGLGWLWLRHGSKGFRGFYRLPWIVTGGLLMWAFGLTYARTVAAVWAVGTAIVAVIPLLQRSSQWRNIIPIRKRLVGALTLLAVVGGLFLAVHLRQVTARASIHGGDEAVRLRLTYARDAFASGGIGGWLARVNWTGVGIGNFTTWLAVYDPALPEYLRQPAHSVYLLAYAETGVLGTIALASFLIAIALRTWRSHLDQPLLRIGILMMFGAVLLAASWDHFFWTLQQGRILFWIVLALAAGSARPYNSHSHV